jgi:hypothetical protein
MAASVSAFVEDSLESPPHIKEIYAPENTQQSRSNAHILNLINIILHIRIQNILSFTWFDTSFLFDPI